MTDDHNNLSWLRRLLGYTPSLNKGEKPKATDPVDIHAALEQAAQKAATLAAMLRPKKKNSYADDIIGTLLSGIDFKKMIPSEVLAHLLDPYDSFSTPSRMEDIASMLSKPKSTFNFSNDQRAALTALARIPGEIPADGCSGLIMDWIHEHYQLASVQFRTITENIHYYAAHPDNLDWRISTNAQSGNIPYLQNVDRWIMAFRAFCEEQIKFPKGFVSAQMLETKTKLPGIEGAAPARVRAIEIVAAAKRAVEMIPQTPTIWKDPAYKSHVDELRDFVRPIALPASILRYNQRQRDKGFPSLV